LMMIRKGELASNTVGPDGADVLQHRVIEIFARSLRRESHNLTQHPELLWQQTFNRLQWEDAAQGVVLPELERRTSPPFACWLRERTRRGESEALLQTLPTAGKVQACAFNLEGKQLVVATDRGTGVLDLDSGNVLHRFNAERDVMGLALSPDGSRLALFTLLDSRVTLCDPRTGNELASLPVDSHKVKALAFSTNGRFLVAAAEQVLYVWDSMEGSLVHVIEGHSGIITGIAFSRDGVRLASAANDKTVKIWELETGALFRTLEGGTLHVHSLAFSPNGSEIVSAGGDPKADTSSSLSANRVKIWNLATGEVRAELKGHKWYVEACLFSPDGTKVLSYCAGERWGYACEDKTLKLWSADSGQELATLEGHSEHIAEARFSPDGSLVASAGYDMTARLWRADSGKEMAILRGHTGAVMAVAFTPDGRRLATGGLDATVKLWDLSSIKPDFAVSVHSGPVGCCTFSPDGKRFASGGLNLKLWDSKTGRELAGLGEKKRTDRLRPRLSSVVGFGLSRPFAIPQRPPGRLRTRGDEDARRYRQCVFTADGRWLLARSGEISIDRWDTQALGAGEPVPGPGIQDFALTADGLRLVLMKNGGAPTLWDLGQVKETVTLEAGEKESAELQLWQGVALSPDGAQALIVRGRKGVFWSTVTAQRGVELAPIHTPCAFSPDGRRAATGSGNRLTVWDVRTGKAAVGMQGRYDLPGLARRCAFSPDGSKIIASIAGHDLHGNRRQEMSLWNANTGEELERIVGPPGVILELFFSPDGRYIVFFGNDILSVRDVTRRGGRARLPVQGATCLAVCPNRPLIVCGDKAGNALLIEVQAVEWGPPITTPVDLGQGYVIRCPYCLTLVPLDESWLGREIECPAENCGGVWKVNPFLCARPGCAEG
jgi:WD40 repeat protein